MTVYVLTRLESFFIPCSSLANNYFYFPGFIQQTNVCFFILRGLIQGTNLFFLFRVCFFSERLYFYFPGTYLANDCIRSKSSINLATPVRYTNYTGENLQGTFSSGDGQFSTGERNITGDLQFFNFSLEIIFWQLFPPGKPRRGHWGGSDRGTWTGCF